MSQTWSTRVPVAGGRPASASHPNVLRLHALAGNRRFGAAVAAGRVIQPGGCGGRPGPDNRHLVVQREPTGLADPAVRRFEAVYDDVVHSPPPGLYAGEVLVELEQAYVAIALPQRTPDIMGRNASAQVALLHLFLTASHGAADHPDDALSLITSVLLLLTEAASARASFDAATQRRAADLRTFRIRDASGPFPPPAAPPKPFWHFW